MTSGSTASAVRPHVLAGGNCRLNKRRVEAPVEPAFEVPIAIGTVMHLEKEMIVELEATRTEALELVRQSSVKQQNETAWKMAHHQCECGSSP